MEDGHNYIFEFHSPAYAEGYERIFGKKVQDAPTQKNSDKGRGPIQKTNGKTTKARSQKPKGSRRKDRQKKVRKAQISSDGG